ncbi:hypothetical protein [Prauserella flavalba]|uniref:Uncharacterized protein n=1 Tax=Prauserella flavalba TaxID=1477506 RepID=A0A318MGH9_9PSEU|nr:hypothetical protein [Prauserella flavalba]PXY38250.1 hypothetical protein BA062_00340 [Prauserella flavalba]
MKATITAFNAVMVAFTAVGVAYRTWVRLFERHRYYSWIVDRFHLSARVLQARAVREVDFGWLEERLGPLGFAVVLCTRTTS